jgi:hypothetical protein
MNQMIYQLPEQNVHTGTAMSLTFKQNMKLKEMCH